MLLSLKFYLKLRTGICYSLILFNTYAFACGAFINQTIKLQKICCSLLLNFYLSIASNAVISIYTVDLWFHRDNKVSNS